jgi:electron transfer flavoprotein beta subunit
MGPESARTALYQALALGSDRAILVTDPGLRESDTLVTSRVLGTALKRLMPLDLVLFGTRSADSDTGHVGPQTAEMTGLAFVGNVHELSFDAGTFQVRRRADGYEEVFQVSGPAAFSVSSSFQEARHTGLGNIETAFGTRTVETWDSAFLGLASSEIGLGASPTRIVSLSGKKPRAACTFLEGSLETQAKALAEHLADAGFVE